MDFSTILEIIAKHASLAYFLIFLASFLESLAFVGLILPGAILMFIAGGLIGAGILDLKLGLLMALSGAVMGDGLSYWLGRIYHAQLTDCFLLRRYPALLQRGEAYIQHHGGKSVFLGRFIGPLRPIIPVVAGMLNMPALKYLLYNILSALFWAPIYILPGVFLGTSLTLLGQISYRLSLFIILVLGSLWFTVWIFRNAARLLEKLGELWLNSLESWFNSIDSRQQRSSQFKAVLSYLLFPSADKQNMLIFFLLISFCMFWGFLLLLPYLMVPNSLETGANAFQYFLHSLRTTWADHFFLALNQLHSLQVSAGLWIFIFACLLICKDKRSAKYWLLAPAGGTLLTIFCSGKPIMSWISGLPEPALLINTCLMVSLLGFGVILLTAKKQKTNWWLGFWITFACTGLLGLGRIYLDQAQPLQVLAALSLGWGWVALLAIFYLSGRLHIWPRSLVAAASGLILILLLSWQISSKQVALQHNLRLQQTTVHELTTQAWLLQGWKSLPAFRHDIWGQEKQALNLQFTGDLEGLQAALLLKGWQTSPPLNLSSLFRKLDPAVQLFQLPILPCMHQGRTEDLQLVYNHKEQRFVLRLWQNPQYILAGGFKLYIGLVTEQQKTRPTGLVTVAKDAPGYDQGLEILAQSLGPHFFIHKTKRNTQDTPEKNSPNWMGWTGLIYPARIL